MDESTPLSDGPEQDGVPETSLEAEFVQPSPQELEDIQDPSLREFLEESVEMLGSASEESDLSADREFPESQEPQGGEEIVSPDVPETDADAEADDVTDEPSDADAEGVFEDLAQDGVEVVSAVAPPESVPMEDESDSSADAQSADPHSASPEDASEVPRAESPESEEPEGGSELETDASATPSTPEGDASVQASGYYEEAELDLEDPGIPRPDDEILVEAALFAATDLLSLRNLRELVDPALSAAKVQKLVVSINKRLLEGKHPYEVVSTAGGWRLRTRPELYPWLRGLFKESQAKRLSQAVLETLAVIAYKQPITKAEIEAVRGVSADGALKKLLEKRLVTVSGRTDAVGRPLTYGTTKDFLEYFGINKLPDDLPRLAEFEELVQSRSLLPQVAPGGVLTTREQEEE